MVSPLWEPTLFGDCGWKRVPSLGLSFWMWLGVRMEILLYTSRHLASEMKGRSPHPAWREKAAVVRAKCLPFHTILSSKHSLFVFIWFYSSESLKLLQAKNPHFLRAPWPGIDDDGCHPKRREWIDSRWCHKLQLQFDGVWCFWMVFGTATMASVLYTGGDSQHSAWATRYF